MWAWIDFSKTESMNHITALKIFDYHHETITNFHPHYLRGRVTLSEMGALEAEEKQSPIDHEFVSQKM